MLYACTMKELSLNLKLDIFDPSDGEPLTLNCRDAFLFL